MKRLEKIGFVLIGSWSKEKDRIFLETDDDLMTQNALYSFVIAANIMYIGKTSNTLKKRFNGYINPGSSQFTNLNVNNEIKDAIAKGQPVSVYIFKDPSQLSYGEFNINLAAGLEDSILRIANPVWNTLGKNQATSVLEYGEDADFSDEDWEWDDFFSCHREIINGKPISDTLQAYKIQPFRFLELQRKLPESQRISLTDFNAATTFKDNTDGELKTMLTVIRSQNEKGYTEQFGDEIENELKRRGTLPNKS